MSQTSRIITPTPLEATLYVLLSSLVLIGINISTIAGLFVNSSVLSEGFSVISDGFETFVTLLDTLRFTSTFILAFFWSLFGTMVYIIGFTLYELAVETRHEFFEASSSAVHHPLYYKQGALVRTVVLRSVIRVAACALIAVHAVLMLGLILPLSSQLMHDIVRVREEYWMVVNPISGVLLLALSLHVFTILMRLLFLRPRLTSRLEPVV